jgi:plastocyanin
MKPVFIIAIVAVAMIGIMVPSSFADHAEVAITTVDESGFSQACAASQGGPGCYTPVTATVDVGGVVTMTNTDPTGVHTFTSGTVNGFDPSPDGTFDSSILRSGNSFEWIPTQAGEVQYYCILHTWMIGTIIVQEAHAAEEVIEEVTQLTINSLEIYENADYTRYRVTGDAPASTDITFKTTKPDGSPGNYPGGVNTGKPAYIVDNKIDSANNLVYGTWTLEVCAPEYDMCVEESFTIDEPVTLPDDGATQTEKVVAEEKSTEEGGGCLIATATYGSEMAPQVQQLRELRDNQLLQTESGTAFMGTFNDIYYSFSPVIADMEREYPMFKEAVKLVITPMISSLPLMENANSESEVLSIGISVIVLNLGMYLGVPAIVIVGIRKRF